MFKDVPEVDMRATVPFWQRTAQVHISAMDTLIERNAPVLNLEFPKTEKKDQALGQSLICA